MRDGFYSPASLSIHLRCHWYRFESLLQWLLRANGHSWIVGLGLLLLDWHLPEKKKETLNQTVCWKRPDQLCTSPTTSLLLLWPQTWSQSSKNIIRTCPSQQCFIRAFHQLEQFYLLSPADSLHCRGACLCSHLCLEITTAQEHERTFPRTLGVLKILQLLSVFLAFSPCLFLLSLCRACRIQSEKDSYSESSCFYSGKVHSLGFDLPPGRWGSALSLRPGYPGSTAFNPRTEFSSL